VTGAAPHLTREICIDLVLGNVVSPEADALMEHVSTCAPCEDLLRESATAWERQASREAAGVLAAPQPQVATPALSRWWERLEAGFRRPQWQWGGGLALAGAAAALFFFALPAPDTPSRLLRWLPPLDEIQVRTAEEATVREDLIEGMEAYAERDLDRAVSVLERMEAPEPLEFMRRIYLANALAWQKEYGAAADALDGVPFELIPEPWSGEARWTLYVCLRATGGTEADLLLEQLADQTGAVGERARALVDRSD